MKILILTVLYAAVAVAADGFTEASIRNMYAEWSRKHRRVRGITTPAAIEERYSNFRDNFLQIQRLNADRSATFELNELADQSNDELRARLGFRAPTGQMLSMMGPRVADTPTGDVPRSVDWRATKVAAIQDQGSCGSCWAFSTASNTESRIAIVYNRSIAKLSEQQLVDCDHVCGSYRSVSGCDEGCAGGLMPNAWTYQRDHELILASTYPYTARAGACRDGANRNPNGVVVGFELYSENEDELVATIAQKGPVAIAVDASAWSFYRGGIMKSVCSNTTLDDLNHAVNIVGYGSEDGQDYWIVRNSWGTQWVRGACAFICG